MILDLVNGRTSVSFYESRPEPPEIKKQFLDLAVGAPRGMNPRVLPAQAKQITLVTPLNKKRIIWVAPTRGGGFCSVGGMSGGCISKASERRAGPVTVNGSLSEGRDRVVRVQQVSGHVFSPKVSTLTLEFADGQSMPLPFVYITSPINAGFYALGVPSEHQQHGHWPTRVTARDAHGATVGTAAFLIATHRLPFVQRSSTPRPPQPLPPASSVTPSSPIQSASADGVTVVAGANGAVRITAHNVPSSKATFLRGRISVSCFRLTREFGIPGALGSGVSGAFADSIGLTINSVGRPLDGCEIGSGRGHRWPDPLGSHSTIELPFTAKGRAYFADRAAARDLALFVRSGRRQKIRKQPGLQLLREMKAAYGSALAKSRVRYVLTPHGITLTEKSATGRQFSVDVVHGRIKRSNVAPYAKVF